MEKIPSVLEMGRKEKERKKKETHPLKWSKFFCITVLLCLGIIALGFLFNGKTGLAIATIGFVGIFIYRVLLELKEPFHALVFKKGKPTGEVKPGKWYWVDGFLHKTKTISKAQQHIALPEIGMYKKDGTKITVKRGRISYRAVNLAKTIMLDDPEGKILDVTLAKLKASVGNRNFVGSKGLVTEQGQIEDEMTEGLKKEMKQWGYAIDDVELADFEEEVHSKAEERKVWGAADAEAKGKIASAIAEPLKNNMPAALASIASSLADPLTKLLSEKKQKQTKKGEITNET